ncbi:MAG: hypothetical protein UY15_C0008G0021 [Parcubacteria group bacterium GW2011_GWA2_47_9]|nr:MAG: hypothetical protein UY15_C0008G0021 [Parcubacteria group bacterium GW2011_GWA2_47_9]
MTKGKRGFTLIELLVVIAIIGILSSIVLVSMGTAREQARDARRMADMRQIVSAQELFYGDNNRYYMCSTVNPGTGDCAATVTWPRSIGTYMPKVPVDPKSTNSQYYWANNVTDNGYWFCAYATMEGKGSCATVRYYSSSFAGNSELCAQPTSSATCI